MPSFNRPWPRIQIIVATIKNFGLTLVHPTA